MSLILDWYFGRYHLPRKEMDAPYQVRLTVCFALDFPPNNAGTPLRSVFLLNVIY